MIDIEETKKYLRIDGSDEDNLITSLISTAEEIVEGVVRKPLNDFDVLPETIKQSILFAAATTYENRQGGKGGLDIQSLIDVVKRMTFAYRKEEW